MARNSTMQRMETMETTEGMRGAFALAEGHVR